MSLQQSAGPGPRTRRADGDNTSALSGPRVREPTLAAHSRAAAGDLVKGARSLHRITLSREENSVQDAQVRAVGLEATT